MEEPHVYMWTYRSVKIVRIAQNGLSRAMFRLFQGLWGAQKGYQMVYICTKYDLKYIIEYNRAV